MKKRIYILVLIILNNWGLSMAQDPIFSQFFNNTFLLNPAKLAIQKSNAQVQSLYRSQWMGATGSKPFNASFISYEQKLRHKKQLNDYFAIGGLMMMESSNGGLLKNNFLNFSSAYHNALNEDGTKKISVGLSIVYANRLLDASKFITQSQFGSFGFMHTATNYDPIHLSKNNYFDLNAGVAIEDKQPNFGYRLGASVYHINRPSEGVFKSEEYRVKQKLIIESELYIPSKNGGKWTISANNQMQGKFLLFSLGAMYEKELPNSDYTLGLGLWQRFEESIYPYLSVESKKIKLGFTYDIVTNKVRTTYNNVQSIELSFAWKLGK